MIEIEIINPMGTVSYRRPAGHPDVAEALRTTGYHIRFTLPAEAAELEYGEYYKVGLRLAGIGHVTSDEYSFGANRTTLRMCIWSSWYTPTMPEYQRANDWVADVGPRS